MTPEKIERDRTAGTPGPWRVGPVDDTVVIAPDGSEVAAIDGDYNEPDLWPVMEANARRIARLPELEQAYLDLTADSRLQVMTWTAPEASAQAGPAPARSAENAAAPNVDPHHEAMHLLPPYRPHGGILAAGRRMSRSGGRWPETSLHFLQKRQSAYRSDIGCGPREDQLC